MQELLAAVARQDDEEAERLALLLTAADEPALLELLASTNEDERWWAVRGLALVGSRDSIAPLEQKLLDEAPAVRGGSCPGHGRAPRAIPKMLLRSSRLSPGCWPTTKGMFGRLLPTAWHSVGTQLCPP